MIITSAHPVATPAPIERPTTPVAGPPQDRHTSGGGDFTTLLASLQAFGTAVAAAPPLRVTDLPALGGRRTSSARDGRLDLMRQSDVESRRGGPPRIAGAHVPRDGVAEKAGAEDNQPDARMTQKRQPPEHLAQQTPGRPAPNNKPSAGTPPGRPPEPNIETASDPSRDAARSPERRSAGHAGARPAQRVTPGEKVADPITAAQRFTPPAVRASVESVGLRQATRTTVRAASPPVQSAAGPARAARERVDAANQARRRFHRAAGPSAPRKSSQRAAFERVAKIVRSAGRGNETVARVELDPPAMGHVRVHLRLKNDLLRIRLTAQSPDARDVLMSQGGELRAALERQGVRVQRMDFAATPQDGQDVAHHGTEGFGGGPMPQSHHGTNDTGHRRSAMSDGAADAAPAIAAERTDAPSEQHESQHVTAELRLDVRV